MLDPRQRQRCGASRATPGIDTEPTWSPTGADDRVRLRPQRHVPRVRDGSRRDRTCASSPPAAFTPSRAGRRSATSSPTRMRTGAHEIWVDRRRRLRIARRLTNGGGDNQSPTWSPNGRHHRVPVESSRVAGRSTRCSPTAAPQEPITKGASDSTSPSWSPQIAVIAMCRCRDNRQLHGSRPSQGRSHGVAAVLR